MMFRPFHAGNARELGWDWDAFCEFMQSIDPGPHAVRPRLPLFLGICLLEDLDPRTPALLWMPVHLSRSAYRWEALSRI